MTLSHSNCDFGYLFVDSCDTVMRIKMTQGDVLVKTQLARHWFHTADRFGAKDGHFGTVHTLVPEPSFWRRCLRF